VYIVYLAGSWRGRVQI